MPLSVVWQVHVSIQEGLVVARVFLVMLVVFVLVFVLVLVRVFVEG